MSPEYGATMGFFPFDEISAEYLKATGQGQRTATGFLQSTEYGLGRLVRLCRNTPILLQLDLSTVEPSVAGPKKPQDRLPLAENWAMFSQKAAAEGERTPEVVSVTPMKARRRGCFRSVTRKRAKRRRYRDCCDHGLHQYIQPRLADSRRLSLLRKPMSLGMKVPDGVKTSLASGSPVATDFFDQGRTATAFGCSRI